MERKDYSSMSNSELKLLLETINNEFEAKKSSILRLCEELESLKLKYDNINNEINSRKNLF